MFSLYNETVERPFQFRSLYNNFQLGVYLDLAQIGSCRQFRTVIGDFLIFFAKTAYLFAAGNIPYNNGR